MSQCKLRLKRTFVSFLFCPKCGKWRESIVVIKVGDEHENLCRVCGYDFGEITDSMRVDKNVLAVFCPKCGMPIPCTEENMLFGIGDVKELFCPKCQETIAYRTHRRWVGVRAQVNLT